MVFPATLTDVGHAFMTVNGRTANGRRPLLVLSADSQINRPPVQHALVSEGRESSRRIIVDRHGGEISIGPARGETVLRVWWPRHSTEGRRV